MKSSFRILLASLAVIGVFTLILSTATVEAQYGYGGRTGGYRRGYGGYGGYGGYRGGYGGYRGGYGGYRGGYGGYGGYGRRYNTFGVFAVDNSDQMEQPGHATESQTIEHPYINKVDVTNDDDLGTDAVHDEVTDNSNVFGDSEDSGRQPSDDNSPQEPPQPPETCQPRQYFCQIYKFCYPCFENSKLSQCDQCGKIFECPADDDRCQQRETCTLCASLPRAQLELMPVCQLSNCA